MTDPVCPKTGAPMHRAARPVALTYKGLELTFDMPGWYCAASDESIHTGEDMKVSDRALNRLKGEAEGLSGTRPWIHVTTISMICSKTGRLEPAQARSDKGHGDALNVFRTIHRIS